MSHADAGADAGPDYKPPSAAELDQTLGQLMTTYVAAKHPGDLTRARAIVQEIAPLLCEYMWEC